MSNKLKTIDKVKMLNNVTENEYINSTFIEIVM